jgi:hypothetical protein
MLGATWGYHLFPAVLACSASLLWFSAERDKRTVRRRGLPPHLAERMLTDYLYKEHLAWALAFFTVCSWLWRAAECCPP